MSDGPSPSVAPTLSPTLSAEDRAIEALAELVAVYQARSTQPTRSDVRTDLAPIMTLLRQAGQDAENLPENDEAPAEPDVAALTAWFHEHVTAETFTHATDEDFAYGLLASDWLAGDRARHLSRAEAAEAEVAALREVLHLGTELDNHHNAAMCPYCTPSRRSPAHASGESGQSPEVVVAKVTEAILGAWMTPAHGCDGTEQGCFTTGCPVPAYQLLNPDGLAREAAKAVVEAGFGDEPALVGRVETLRQEMYAEARREDLLPSPRHYLRVFADRVGRAIGTAQTAQTTQSGQADQTGQTGRSGA